MKLTLVLAIFAATMIFGGCCAKKPCAPVCPPPCPPPVMKCVEK